MKALSLWHGVYDDGRRLPSITLRGMLHDFCGWAEATPAQILGDRRLKPIAMARQDFMLFAYDNSKFTTPQIGRFLNRDHSTVVHGIQQARKRAAA